MIIIAKNTTSTTIDIQDLGLRIKQGTKTELDSSNLAAISQSDELKSYIESGAIVINNGTDDLSTSEALDYINTEVDLSSYYTKVETNSLLNDKSNVGHHHDSRYYTESEVDDKIAAVETFGIKGAVDTFSDLPGGQENDIYIVRQDDGTNDEGFYQYDGSEWVWLSHNTGATSHNELSNLNTGDYQHLTSAQLDELTTQIETNLHKHDDRYYTENEIDSFLSDKADENHDHNDLYYTKTQVDNLIDSIDYARVSSNDSNTNVTGSELEALTNGSNANGLHNHGNGDGDEDEDEDEDGGGSGSGGLDEAYDNHSQWSHGGGREIDVDYGPVTLNASNGFAPLRLQEINYVPNQWLNTGHICVYDSELFIYDATRSCWNSVSGYSISGSKSGDAKNSYLRMGDGVNFNDVQGWVAPWNGVVVSLMGANKVPTQTSLQLRKNGNITSAQIWFNNSNKCWSNDIDEKFNQGDILSFYISGNYNNENPIVWAIIKRRI